MEDWTIKTILVGYDGSEGAERAVALAAALALRDHARLIVVTAFPHGYDPTDPGPHGLKAKELTDRLLADGIDAEQDILQASASESLLRAADAHKVDLIVVGRRGHGLTAGLFLGSTSEHVVRHAGVPVLVAH
jgi:nucleotide-binding universal stress UspA family protein